MPEKTGVSFRFVGYFRKGNQGYKPTDCTVDIVSLAAPGALVKTAVAATRSDDIAGLVYYVLTGADAGANEADFMAVFKTTDTSVDSRNEPSFETTRLWLSAIPSVAPGAVGGLGILDAAGNMPSRVNTYANAMSPAEALAAVGATLLRLARLDKLNFNGMAASKEDLEGLTIAPSLQLNVPAQVPVGVGVRYFEITLASYGEDFGMLPLDEPPLLAVSTPEGSSRGENLTPKIHEEGLPVTYMTPIYSPDQGVYTALYGVPVDAEAPEFLNFAAKCTRDGQDAYIYAQVIVVEEIRVSLTQQDKDNMAAAATTTATIAADYQQRGHAVTLPTLPATYASRAMQEEILDVVTAMAESEPGGNGPYEVLINCGVSGASLRAVQTLGADEQTAQAGTNGVARFGLFAGEYTFIIVAPGFMNIVTPRTIAESTQFNIPMTAQALPEPAPAGMLNVIFDVRRFGIFRDDVKVTFDYKADGPIIINDVAEDRRKLESTTDGQGRVVQPLYTQEVLEANGITPTTYTVRCVDANYKEVFELPADSPDLRVPELVKATALLA